MSALATDPSATVDRILNRVPVLTNPSAFAVPPFPLETLPPQIRELVCGGAAAIGCPKDFIAVPLLPALGAALGSQVIFEIKAGLRNRAILWTAVVGLPGTGKTPGEELATSGLRAIQDDHAAEFEQARSTWEQEPAKGRGQPPRMQRALMGDATIESLAVALAASHGILVTRDELSSWLGGFARYRNEGSDRSAWLSIWSGSVLDQERLSRSTVYVPRPHVCISGGVQPDRIGLLTGDANDGFPDRFLGTWPDANPVPLSDETIPVSAVAELRSLTRLLRNVPSPPTQYMSPGQSNVWRAVPSRAAFERYREWHDDNLDAITNGHGLGRGWAAKAPHHLQRLALLLHAIWNPSTPGGVVAVETMDRAAILVEYFRAHHQRIVSAAGTGVIANPRQRPLPERLIGLLRRKGNDEGWVSASELAVGIRTANKEEIASALNDLAAAGTVESVIHDTATKPRRDWRLVEQPSPTFKPSKNSQNAQSDGRNGHHNGSSHSDALNKGHSKDSNPLNGLAVEFPPSRRGEPETFEPLNDCEWEEGRA
jgi:hypothetical protein